MHTGEDIRWGKLSGVFEGILFNNLNCVDVKVDYFGVWIRKTFSFDNLNCVDVVLLLLFFRIKFYSNENLGKWLLKKKLWSFLFNKMASEFYIFEFGQL